MRAFLTEVAVHDQVGRRIAYWREHRGLTQAELGRLMGQSRRWVQDLEGGHRQTDPRLSVLLRAAVALRVPLARLMADEPANAEPTPPPEVSALADVLVTPIPDGEGVQVTALEKRITYCCQAWAAGHYTAVARELTAVLPVAHRTAETTSAAAVLLSRAYQLSASLLFKFGAATRTPAVLAADRALAAAQQAGDAVAMGAAARRVTRGLIHQRRYAAAVGYATDTATTLRPDLERHGPAGLSTLGMLYLVAAVAATGDGRSQHAISTATEQLETAREVALIDERSGDFTEFGLTNVQLHEADVLLRLDDAWSALETARKIEPQAVRKLSRERQSRFLITTARAAALTRRREDAIRDLLNAERLAPEELRRPDVLRLVAELLELVPTPSAKLTGLARRCGLQT
ncbi:helix-turn-helix domain-containing protein [Streptomyces alkaliterrae]|uniref:helix-turn-helix domain-containing protein n=1 Tax=Streptomyces alkaliterrae TaxID=2213162 RepID=UPI002B1F484D|nr:helix-turn-helix transcriptional regulator [Streptomyces alkaliterrae]